jgi:hypothetical protein
MAGKLGTLAKNGLIDPRTMYDLSMSMVLHLWIVLSVVVEQMRRDGFNAAFDNAEWLYADGERWARRYLGSPVVDRLLVRYRASVTPTRAADIVESVASE